MNWQDHIGKLYQGDFRNLTAQLPNACVDTVITDPPYELGFMGKTWDRTGISFNCQTWAELCRVAKPGATMLVFGGSRTFHRIAVACEDGGWLLRDTIMWLYGAGFPKSLDISKAIDKAAGEERRVVGHRTLSGRAAQSWKEKGGLYSVAAPSSAGMTKDVPITAPATPEATLWSGWGTALKPAYEPILVFMKPCEGTFAQNALKHGLAGLNVDGCRIPVSEGDPEIVHTPARGTYGFGPKLPGKVNPVQAARTDGKLGVRHNPCGRWPANVVMDEDAAAMLDEQAGERGGGYGIRGTSPHWGPASGDGGTGERVGFGDRGGPSRFFYCAKASRAEREVGLENLPVKHVTCRPASDDDEDRTIQEQLHGRKARNHHPTVKPLALMRWLVRLTATPTGGLVLDPFAGSGSTLIACELEGRPWIGAEMDAEYVKIARARLAYWKG